MKKSESEKFDTNPERWIASILDETGIGESGRVLVVLGAAEEKQITINDEMIDSYLLLLNNSKIVSTRYSFRYLGHLPTSHDLRDDLERLEEAGYLSKNPSVSLTQRGQNWVQDRLGSYKRVVVQVIGNRLEAWSQLTEGQLLDEMRALNRQ